MVMDIYLSIVYVCVSHCEDLPTLWGQNATPPQHTALNIGVRTWFKVRVSAKLTETRLCLFALN